MILAAVSVSFMNLSSLLFGAKMFMIITFPWLIFPLMNIYYSYLSFLISFGLISILSLK